MSFSGVFQSVSTCKGNLFYPSICNLLQSYMRLEFGMMLKIPATF